jgi:hypothetical protein
MLLPVSRPSTASAPSCFGDTAAEQGAILFSKCHALHDSQYYAQAAQAAHARCSKQLKLKRDLSWPKSPTKGSDGPNWPRFLKEDPGRYMALYKADYIYTLERTNLRWNKTRSTPPSIAVRNYTNVSAKKVKYHPFRPPLAGKPASCEHELIATVYRTSQRQGPALYITQNITG